MRVEDNGLFFSSQPFITWGVRADHGSYFITMYTRTEQHEERKGKKKRKQK